MGPEVTDHRGPTSDRSEGQKPGGASLGVGDRQQGLTIGTPKDGQAAGLYGYDRVVGMMRARAAKDAAAKLLAAASYSPTGGSTEKPSMESSEQAEGTVKVVARHVRGFQAGDHNYQINSFEYEVEEVDLDLQAVFSRSSVRTAFAELSRNREDVGLQRRANSLLAEKPLWRVQPDLRVERVDAPGIGDFESFFNTFLVVEESSAIQVGNYSTQRNKFLYVVAPTFDAAQLLGDNPDLRAAIIEGFCARHSHENAAGIRSELREALETAILQSPDIQTTGDLLRLPRVGSIEVIGKDAVSVGERNKQRNKTIARVVVPGSLVNAVLDLERASEDPYSDESDGYIDIADVVAPEANRQSTPEFENSKPTEVRPESTEAGLDETTNGSSTFGSDSLAPQSDPGPPITSDASAEHNMLDVTLQADSDSPIEESLRSGEAYKETGDDVRESGFSTIQEYASIGQPDVEAARDSVAAGRELTVENSSDPGGESPLQGPASPTATTASSQYFAIIGEAGHTDGRDIGEEARRAILEAAISAATGLGSDTRGILRLAQAYALLHQAQSITWRSTGEMSDGES